MEHYRWADGLSLSSANQDRKPANETFHVKQLWLLSCSSRCIGLELNALTSLPARSAVSLTSTMVPRGTQGRELARPQMHWVFHVERFS